VSVRHPDAVVFGGAAARMSFWPDAPMRTIDVAAPTRVASRPGYTFSRRHIPAELVVERAGLRFTTPALTAIDLATFECADAIDIALRTRVATLEGMYEALRLTPNRAGNQQRLRLLIDSRNEPWSAAERLAHRILRAARLTGWEANFAVFSRAAAITSTSRSRISNSQSRLTAGSTKKITISSSRTDGDRTTWSRMAGVCCGSPGRCFRSIPRSSSPRFFRQLFSKTDAGLTKRARHACKIGAGVRK
jgi:hypothetical protein